ncbi:putative membrane protein [Bradyrhizobium sp. USDA 4354]
MCKLILIAAMSLLTTQAYAGGVRSLSLAASTANQQATEQPATQTGGTPQATQSPAAAQPATTQTATTPPIATTPTATATTAASAAPIQTTTKPKRRAPSVESRVIRELHRHGIYW